MLIGRQSMEYELLDVVSRQSPIQKDVSGF